MRRFHSYSPVDCERHFCVKRGDLVEKCLTYLIDDPVKGGHYFTIWGPRQTGKTWLAREVVKEVGSRYDDMFLIGAMSMQGIVMEDNEPDSAFLLRVPLLMQRAFGRQVNAPVRWEEWPSLFGKDGGLFSKPVILIVDEFDNLPPTVIDRLVWLFRDMYLNREQYWLHSLALVGVRAVLGIESQRGSPFNIQRSFYVPNLTEEEVRDLFRQYQEESGQGISLEVAEKVYEVTRGQPGLVSWFGELITEKFNPGKEKSIDMTAWEHTYMRACTTEWNNTVLNLIKKAKGQYRGHVMELFANSNVPFTLDTDWCNYLYLNGIIDYQPGIDSLERETEFCRFSNPFVQLRIYNSLTYDLIGDRSPGASKKSQNSPDFLPGFWGRLG